VGTSFWASHQRSARSAAYSRKCSGKLSNTQKSFFLRVLWHFNHCFFKHLKSFMASWTLLGVAPSAYPRRCGVPHDAIGKYQAQDSIFGLC
jgi:hypothetical protein